VRSEQRVHCALHVTRNEELRLAGGPMQRSTKLIQLELADADARYAPADNLYVCATNSREAVRAAAEQFGYAAANPPTSAPGLDRRAHTHLRRELELGLRAVAAAARVAASALGHAGTAPCALQKPRPSGAVRARARRRRTQPLNNSPTIAHWSLHYRSQSHTAPTHSRAAACPPACLPLGRALRASLASLS
jgi:hypothetical protein